MSIARVTSEPLADALLRAAEQEISERGIDSVSLRGIARRVGVSHQAPGHCFKDRIGLFTALAAKGFRTLERDLKAAERRAQPSQAPAERIAVLGVAYIRFATKNDALFSVMFRSDLQNIDDQELAEARIDSFSVVVRMVASARAEGWGREHSEQVLVLTCWSAVHGSVALWREGTLDIMFPGLTIKQVAAGVTEALTAGLAAEASRPAAH